MGLIAAAMFVTLYAFGSQLVGWTDTGGNVELGLIMAFVFGIIAGYRARG